MKVYPLSKSFGSWSSALGFSWPKIDFLCLRECVTELFIVFTLFSISKLFTVYRKPIENFLSMGIILILYSCFMIFNCYCIFVWIHGNRTTEIWENLIQILTLTYQTHQLINNEQAFLKRSNNQLLRKIAFKHKSNSPKGPIKSIEKSLQKQFIKIVDRSWP